MDVGKNAKLGTRDEIQRFCIEYLAKVTGKPHAVLNPEADFASLGLDSATAVSLVFELEERLAIDLAPSLMFEHPSIARLAGHLETRVTKGGA
jgi:phthiocerol/phenolphthiocerol synthesis type-I polyketide synthase C